MSEVWKRSDCPISFSLDIFGDKWSLLIIRDIMFKDKRNYGEFASADEKIATNILADRLSILEKTGIIKKEKDPDHKSKFIYSLTKKGIDLLPVLIEIIKWGAMYDKDTATPPEFIKRVKNNKENVIKEFMDQLRKAHLKK